MAMPIALMAGGAIHYTRVGSGKPIIMLLPQSGGPVGTKPFVDRLAEKFSIIRYDQRGIGKSPPPENENGMSIDARTDEVTGLLDVIGIERTYLCCHSTGCGIGLAYASAKPEQVDALILINPWHWADSHLVTMQQLRIAVAKTLDPYQYSKFNASLLFPPEYRRTHQIEFEEMAESAKLAPHDAIQIEKRLNAILEYDTRPVTKKIRCPTLIVTAQDDQLMPAWFGQDLAADMNNAELVVLERGGHMLPETRHSELVSEIVKFFKSRIKICNV